MSMAVHPNSMGKDQGLIRVVHVVFKTHLDIGYTDMAHVVVEHYMTQYIPAAINLARTLRARGGPERFIWTTGSWLIDAYLEQASPTQRRRMEEAIAAGDIAWHGLPFTTHSELVEPSLFQEGLRITHDLDRRFGKRTIAAKMTDVPGHTRAIVPLLAEAGIRFLHIGVNPGASAPGVPPVFVWRDPSGAEVVVMYHKTFYGGLMAVPGLDEALLLAHTGDNRGPQSAADVRATFERVREQFPGATVVASTLDRFADALLRIKNTLPVVTYELGDTWIHGVASDPGKVARYRELARLRREWLASGQICPDEPDLARFSRTLLLVPEHTWGLDTKRYLSGDTRYEVDTFHAARSENNYQTLEASWAEQRAYVDTAVDALDHEGLARQARERLTDLEPTRPDTTGWPRLSVGADELETTHFSLRINPQHGALSSLRSRQTGRLWASEQHPMGLVGYQTFSAADFERFYRQYIIDKRRNCLWTHQDYGKAGLETTRAESRWWPPQLMEAYHRYEHGAETLTLWLTLPDESVEVYGAPRHVALTYTLPDAEAAIYLTLQWFDKQACRLPEAIWLSFNPVIRDDGQWSLDKMGEWISPHDVIRNGNRTLHAVQTGVAYHDARGRLSIETLDAPLVAPGRPALWDFTNRQPSRRTGMHVNLYNNLWGVNFTQWYADDARFRFVLREASPALASHNEGARRRA